MRAFVSPVIAAAVMAFLLIAAGIQLSLSSLAAANSKGFEAKKVSDRFSDTTNFFEKTIADALADSAFYACGCSLQSPSLLYSRFTVLLNSYLSNSSRLLSDNAVSVSYSSLSPTSFSVSSCNATFSSSISLVLSANSSNSFLSKSVLFENYVEVYRNPPVFRTVVSKQGTLLLNVTVLCP